MHASHDGLSAGHQGVEKTLARLRQEAFWVNMVRVVEEYCVTCQCSKMTMPIRAPMLNMPIGRMWQMIAVDILEMPVSTHNRYLMVVQDYFSKWAEAIPLRDQTASFKHHGCLGETVLYLRSYILIRI